MDMDVLPFDVYTNAEIFSGKTVLGICLGAQLIADTLGARVYQNKYREIGWFDIIRSKEAENTLLAKALPQKAKGLA